MDGAMATIQQVLDTIKGVLNIILDFFKNLFPKNDAEDETTV